MKVLGVDVQIARGVTWAAIDHGNRSVGAGQLAPGPTEEVLAALLDVIRNVAAGAPIHVGIDAPRQPLLHKRTVTWSTESDRWVDCLPRIGRHCEIIVRACRIANPQWTPTVEDTTREWMKVGFEIFEAVESAGYAAHEVFPSASFSALHGSMALLTIDLGCFRPAPRDILDAYVAAYTVSESLAGRGCEVGGGDGLGSIVLPRPLPPATPAALLEWPGK